MKHVLFTILIAFAILVGTSCTTATPTPTPTVSAFAGQPKIPSGDRPPASKPPLPTKAAPQPMTATSPGEKLIGTWHGKSSNGEMGTLGFKSNGELMIASGGLSGQGTYAVDFSFNPARLDMDGDWLKGKKLATIIEFADDNTFRLEEVSPGQTRPTTFSAKVTMFTKQSGEPVIAPTPIASPTATRVSPTATRAAATATTKPTATKTTAANLCNLQAGQSGILFVNTYDFKVLLTVGGGEWGTHDYWFEPKSTTPIQFPPGKYTATLTIPGKGNYKFSNDRVDFAAGQCYRFTTP